MPHVMVTRTYEKCIAFWVRENTTNGEYQLVSMSFSMPDAAKFPHRQWLRDHCADATPDRRAAPRCPNACHDRMRGRAKYKYWSRHNQSRSELSVVSWDPCLGEIVFCAAFTVMSNRIPDRFLCDWYGHWDASLIGFEMFRRSLMNHSSHVESPSMFPLAPAVKLVDVAATTKPPLLGATETLHGAVAVELPVNGATVVLFPIALTPAAYQN